jgi:hypothetical protein
MKIQNRILYAFGLLLSCFTSEVVYAQQTINCSGGNFEGSPCGYIEHLTIILNQNTNTSSPTSSAVVRQPVYQERLMYEPQFTSPQERPKETPIKYEPQFTSPQERPKETPIKYEPQFTSKSTP